MSPEFARSAGQGGAEAAIVYGSIDRERQETAASGNARATSSARASGSARASSNARAGNSARTTSSAGASGSARATGSARASGSARATSSAGASGSARAAVSTRTGSSARAGGSARASGSARAAGSAREGGGEVTAELSYGEGGVAAPVGAYADKVKKAATHPFCDIQPLFHIVGQRRGDPGGKEQRTAQNGGNRIDEGADLTEELRHYL